MELPVSLGQARTSPVTGVRSLGWTAISVIALLCVQAVMLAYSATRHSPTHLEPAFLVSGISHLQFRRFELYRVNPPLVRTMAALPVFFLGYEADWSNFHESPGSRAEFSLGEDFIKANGQRGIRLFYYARWACIPFSLLAAYVAYRWAMELYQSAIAGLVTLTLFIFEPNLLAHGELITPDAACTAFGVLAGYTFWRWLKRPSWMRAGLAGVALGLAEISKMSWLILFGLWPLLWLVWRFLRKPPRRELDKPNPRENESAAAPMSEAGSCHDRSISEHSDLEVQPSVLQLATVLLIAIYVINACYLFDGFGTRLKDFQFVCTTLTGHEKTGVPGNRFLGSWLGELPVVFPKQYLLGFDSQKKDLEEFSRKSYLRGEWKDGGWWYYYIYGLLVKVPCGTWGLLAMVVAARLIRRDRIVPLRDELVLLLPAVTLLVVVSSQTEFNLHLRYVFPTLGMVLIFLGQIGALIPPRLSLGSLVVGSLVGYSVASTLAVYPHHLAYFNDFVGGPKNGHKHLLGSSLDWGQDLFEVVDWLREQFPSHERQSISFEVWSISTVRAIAMDASQIEMGASGAAIVVYWADRFYSSGQAANPDVEIVKTFPSGTVVVKIHNRAR